jgi:hypothetical protein
MRSVASQKSGRAVLAGQSSTLAASRNGRRTKARLCDQHPVRYKKRQTASSGGVPGAIYRKTTTHPLTTAGARRSWTHDPFQVYLPTHVVRHVVENASSLRHALIHVISSVMLVPVHPARPWVPGSIAFVAKKKQPEDVLKPATSLGGVVVLSAVT